MTCEICNKRAATRKWRDADGNETKLLCYTCCQEFYVDKPWWQIEDIRPFIDLRPQTGRHDHNSDGTHSNTCGFCNAFERDLKR